MNIILLITSYLIGAFPTGYLLARFKGIADIRRHGSGSIGATNVARKLGVPYFFLITLLDAGKAFFCIYILSLFSLVISVEELYIYAAALLFGNSCSIFLAFSGGKGVATLAGLLLVLQPYALLFLSVIWSVTLCITRTVGIASVISVISLTVYAFLCSTFSFFIWSVIVALWIIWLHRANLLSYAQYKQKK